MADGRRAPHPSTRTSPPARPSRIYARRWWDNVKSGDLGSLPIILGLIVIAIIFQSQNDRFLTAGNFVNLIIQGAAFATLGMGIVFVLLLGEIDLSIGFVSGVAGVLCTLLLLPDGNEVAPAVALAAALGGRRRDRPAARADHHEDRGAVVRRDARGAARVERRRAAAHRQSRHRDPAGRLHHRHRQRLPDRQHGVAARCWSRSASTPRCSSTGCASARRRGSRTTRCSSSVRASPAWRSRSRSFV